MAERPRRNMSFDLLAPHYRWLEIILAGEKLHRCRTAFLDEIPAAQNILLLGEGHGRCLIECRRRFPNARITCVDASAAMLTQARRQLLRHNLKTDRVEFIHADVLDWTPGDGNYDLVSTNFFLDCFRADQIQQLVTQVTSLTRPNANWLSADFQNAATGWQRLRSRIILWSMYRFFRVATRLPAQQLVTPDSFLEQAGFHLHRRTESEWHLLHSDWWIRTPAIAGSLEQHGDYKTKRQLPKAN